MATDTEKYTFIFDKDGLTLKTVIKGPKGKVCGTYPGLTREELETWMRYLIKEIYDQWV